MNQNLTNLLYRTERGSAGSLVLLATSTVANTERGSAGSDGQHERNKTTTHAVTEPSSFARLRQVLLATQQSANTERGSAGCEIQRPETIDGTTDVSWFSRSTGALLPWIS